MSQGWKIVLVVVAGGRFVNPEVETPRGFHLGPPRFEEADLTTPMRNPEFIYKIATAENFAAAKAAGTYTGMPIDAEDGYIHFSTASQLAETLGLYFKGQKGIVLFAVRSYDMGSMLRWEPSRGGQLFPHLYGQLHIGAVGQYATVSVDADGNVELPEWVR